MSKWLFQRSSRRLPSAASAPSSAPSGCDRMPVAARPWHHGPFLSHWRACRQLILSKQLTTTELAQRIYSGTQSWQVGNVRRAAPKFAEVGRRRSAGAPIMLGDGDGRELFLTFRLAVYFRPARSAWPDGSARSPAPRSWRHRSPIPDCRMYAQESASIEGRPGNRAAFSFERMASAGCATLAVVPVGNGTLFAGALSACALMAMRAKVRAMSSACSVIRRITALDSSTTVIFALASNSSSAIFVSSLSKPKVGPRRPHRRGNSCRRGPALPLDLLHSPNLYSARLSRGRTGALLEKNSSESELFPPRLPTCLAGRRIRSTALHQCPNATTQPRRFAPDRWRAAAALGRV
jgi:hypothetical protein